MPPKKQFTKEQIVEAAFEIARKEGMDGLTVRKIADRLGCSVAPVYVNFKNVDELRAAVVKRTYKAAEELLMATQTGHRFLDIGVASLRFAKKYSVLFRDLVLKENPYIAEQQEETDGELVELMKTDPDLSRFTVDELKRLLLKMKLFQLGLSVMVANNALPKEFDEEAQIRLLSEVGEEIATAMAMKQQQVFKMGDSDE